MPANQGLRLSLTFLAIGAIATLVLIARGVGGSEEAADAGPVAAEPAWIQAAREVCERQRLRRERQTQRFRERAGDEISPGQRVWLARRVLAPSIRRLGAELGEISVPAGQRREFKRMVRAFRSGVRQLEADPWLVVREKRPNIFGRAARVASELGIEACAR